MLADATGRANIELSVDSVSSLLKFWDSTRQRHVVLGVFSDKSPFTPKQVVRLGRMGLIRLVVAPDGTPGLTLRDAAGRELFHAP